MSAPTHLDAQRAIARQLLRALVHYEQFLSHVEQGRLRPGQLDDEVRCIGDLDRYGEITPALSASWIRFHIGHIGVLQAWSRSGYESLLDETLRLACEDQRVLLRMLRKKAMVIASAVSREPGS